MIVQNNIRDDDIVNNCVYFQSKNQQVEGMRYSEERIHWDNEDTNPTTRDGDSHPYPGASSSYDVDIKYCYYYR